MGGLQDVDGDDDDHMQVDSQMNYTNQMADGHGMVEDVDDDAMEGVSAATNAQMLTHDNIQDVDGGGEQTVECFKYVVLEDGNIPVNIVDYEPIIDSI